MSHHICLIYRSGINHKLDFTVHNPVHYIRPASCCLLMTSETRPLSSKIMVPLVAFILNPRSINCLAISVAIGFPYHRLMRRYFMRQRLLLPPDFVERRPRICHSRTHGYLISGREQDRLQEIVKENTASLTPNEDQLFFNFNRKIYRAYLVAILAIETLHTLETRERS